MPSVQAWRDFAAVASRVHRDEYTPPAAHIHPDVPRMAVRNPQEERQRSVLLQQIAPHRRHLQQQQQGAGAAPATGTARTPPSLPASQPPNPPILEPDTIVLVEPGLYHFIYTYNPSEAAAASPPSLPVPELDEHTIVATANGILAPGRTEIVCLKDLRKQATREKAAGKFDAQRKLDQLTENDCDACYNEFEAPVSTTCGYIFCLMDILPWVEEKGKCPKCRTSQSLRDLTNLVVDRNEV